jgi:hypothetical protein
VPFLYFSPIKHGKDSWYDLYSPSDKEEDKYGTQSKSDAGEIKIQMMTKRRVMKLSS